MPASLVSHAMNTIKPSLDPCIHADEINTFLHHATLLLHIDYSSSSHKEVHRQELRWDSTVKMLPYRPFTRLHQHTHNTCIWLFIYSLFQVYLLLLLHQLAAMDGFASLLLLSSMARDFLVLLQQSCMDRDGAVRLFFFHSPEQVVLKQQKNTYK